MKFFSDAPSEVSILEEEIGQVAIASPAASSSSLGFAEASFSGKMQLQY